MSATHSALLAIVLFGGLACPAPADDLSSAKKPATPKFDVYGDPIPPDAYARFGTNRSQHEAKAIAFLDKNTIVSVGAAIQFWDAATGRLVKIHRHEKMRSPEHAAISADGKRAIVSYQNCIYRVWDLATGKLEREFENNGESRTIVDSQGFRELSASSDGSRFAALELKDGDILPKVAIYSPNSQASKMELQSGSDEFRICQISPDGKLVVTTAIPPQSTTEATRVLTYWDAVSGRKIRTDDPGIDQIDEVQFMPGGKAVVVVGANGILLRTIEGKNIWRLKDEFPFYRIACVRDENVIIAGAGAALSMPGAVVIDAATGKSVRSAELRGEALLAAASPDGSRLAIVEAGRLCVLNLADGTRVHCAISHSAPVVQIRISSDARYVFSADSESSDVIMWDISSGRLVRRFEASEYLQHIDVSPDGKLLAAIGGDAIRIWETATGRVAFDQPGSRQISCLGMHFLADSRRLAMTFCTQDTTIFDCKDREVVNEFSTPHSYVGERFMLHADGRLLAISSSFSPFEDPDSRMQGIVIWDVLSRQSLHHINCYDGESFISSLSGDCRTLATWGKDNKIRIWEMSTGRQRLAIADAANAPEASWHQSSLAVSADGTTVASIGGDRMNVDLWDLSSGCKFGSLKGHERPINGVRFTPDGRRLLTYSEDTTILGWDMTRPEWRAPLLTRRLSDEEAASHWDRLRNGTAEDAYRSMWALAGDPARSVAFVRGKLLTPPSVPVETIRAWIADLDAPQYSDRERASRHLQNHADQAGLEIRAALKSTASAEASRRMTQILASLESAVPDPDHLRELRAVEMLEKINTPEARDLLRTLAKSANSIRTGLDAAESLKRLECRNP